MSKVTVVVGGQYGSEAKGAVTGYISQDLGPEDVVIRVAGPNAGHTVYDEDGRRWALRQVPVAAVTSKTCQLHIAAGSEIDPIVLADEVTELEKAGHRVGSRLTLHPSATILTRDDIAEESISGIIGRIGSTGKGIGAARSARIARIAPIASDLYSGRNGVTLSEGGPFDLDGIRYAVVEGTQGYGLGLHHRNYPQVTSSDCRAIDFLGMAGISPWSVEVEKLIVIVVARCFPIRVAGNSGPLKDETSWEELGLPQERTTVTQKIRRVGGWDSELLEEAIAANGGGGWNPQVVLAITMLDQMYPELAGVTDPGKLTDEAADFLLDIQDQHETDIVYVGTSPTTLMEVAL